MKVFFNILVLVASLMAVSTSAQTVIYAFSSLNGAGADPPNNSPGVAFGTLAITESSGTLNLDITYTNLSSDFTKVACTFGNSLTGSVGVEFGPVDLPPSGHWTASRTVPVSYISDMFTYVKLGEGDVQVGTVNYPIAGFGEIGGIITPVPVPEPSSTALMFLAVSLSLAHRISQKTKGLKQPFHEPQGRIVNYQ